MPYTAVMFLLGTIMGIGVVVVEGNDHISESLYLWNSIDSEVLLLVFLPGLIFKDAHGLNVHLFRVALPQCLLFAFPMVLAGTALTACIAYYIFPYGWSFDLAMCFGAMYVPSTLAKPFECFYASISHLSYPLLVFPAYQQQTQSLSHPCWKKWAHRLV